MSQLFSQLGIDWHLLLSQAVNFFLLLVILRFTVYRPLLKLLHDRREKIEQGLVKADEADRRLLEAEEISKDKIKAAEAEVMAILRKTEQEAKALEAKMLGEAKTKEADALKNAQALLRAQEEASRRMAEKEAADLVRRAIMRTVELAPEAIDGALVARAVEEAKKPA
ncbi:MAG TPA: ATP synthase F0 subunit B [Candidatus Paceibacterota bacterium]|nr:ATP synthase F0 subunit B [Candidatus Paceibacterota bacterium]